jgi:hypothetical protein
MHFASRQLVMPMALLETLTVEVGGAVAKLILKVWLKDSSIAQDVSLPVADILLKKVPGVLERRRAQRQLDRMGEEIAEKLMPYFEMEFRGLPENEKNAEAIAVARTLEYASLNTSLLLAADLDPLVLAANLDPIILDEYSEEKTSDFFPYPREPIPIAARDLSDAGLALYKFTLRETCNYVVEITSTLPSFVPETMREILQRETTIIDLATKLVI